VIENITALLQADTALATYIEGRIYMMTAPQNAPEPFVVWQPISNVAYNSLSDAPDSDQQRIQIDVYAADPVIAREAMWTARNYVERYHSVIDGPLAMGRDPDTLLSRYSMDCSVFHRRAPYAPAVAIVSNGVLN
tara:strand:+ start:11197 stop:11601 length:405 start_codon:yes stop_codon:yes gene_type:complete